MILALFAAVVSGALLAALICKGIQVKLWLEVLAGVGALIGTWSSAILAGSAAWPLLGVAAGFGTVVGWLRFKGVKS